MSPSKRPVRGEIAIGGEPRVDLLPPEVRIARRGAASRRWLILLLVLCVFAVIGGYAFTALQAAASAQRLADAQSQTSQIVAQQSKYETVNDTSAAIAAEQAAARVGTSTEIDWQNFVLSLGTPGGNVKNLVVDSVSPVKAFDQSALPLAVSRIATVQIVATAGDLASAQGWIASLPSVKGVASVTVASLQSEAGGSYDVNLTIGVNTDVLKYPSSVKEGQ